jgi:uncharacterized protein (TIGR02246 family)
MHPARPYRRENGRESLGGNCARRWRRSSRAAVAAALALLWLGPAVLPAAPGAQNQKNNQKEADATGIASLMPLPDAQAIELMVSQMLGAWQIGDIEMLHSHYADDVLVVSGMWEPPLQGWQNYVRAYQAQRARTQSVRLDRTNTFVKVQGETAWCTYQWDFFGQVDGSPSNAAGHTTLVLQKRGGKWLIVLNHTSVAPLPPRPVPATAVPQGSQPEIRPASARRPGA